MLASFVFAFKPKNKNVEPKWDHVLHIYPVKNNSMCIQNNKKEKKIFGLQKNIYIC